MEEWAFQERQVREQATQAICEMNPTNVGRNLLINPEPVPFSPSALIGGTKKMYGHASGTSREVEETMRFAALTGVRPMIEQIPLDHVGDAFDRMLSGQARFRMVLTTGR